MLKTIFKDVEGFYPSRRAAYNALQVVYDQHEGILMEDFQEFMFWFEHCGFLLHTSDEIIVAIKDGY